MCGFILGSLCLVALVKMVRGGCHGRFRGGCGGCGGGGCGGFGHRHHGHHGFDHGDGHGSGPFGGSRMGDFLLRRVSSELNATPAQEKALREILGSLRDVMSKNRETLRSARENVAKTLRSESFSEEALAEAVTRHDEVHESLRKALVDAVGKLHTTFDSDQRQRLADLIAQGPFFGRW